MHRAATIEISEARGLEGAVWLDCSVGGGSVGGAIRVDLEADLSEVGDPAVGGRHPLPALEDWAARLGRWGIGPDTPVVVFDGKGGGLYAARCWWMLRAAGHERVWVAQGVPSGFSVDPAGPRDPYPTDRWIWPIADIDEVSRRLDDPDWVVIDARSAPRWRGEVEPIDPVPGRIPGTVNLPWESMVRDGRLLPAAELRERLEAVIGNRRAVAQCGSGVTACHTLLAMVEAGMEPAALYVGSYSEWCRSDRPIARGGA